jgi:(p)ppGpp synthase/HD superfamily hydrolase
VTDQLRDLIDRARAFAAKVHEGQFRFDRVTPYIAHPEAVAAAVADEDKPVAWLHDTIEDTKEPGITLAAMKEVFPEPVVEAVLAMTKRPNEEYGAYVERVKANPVARRVKVADIRHNLDGKCSERRREKYLGALAILERG